MDRLRPASTAATAAAAAGVAVAAYCYCSVRRSQRQFEAQPHLGRSFSSFAFAAAGSDAEVIGTCLSQNIKPSSSECTLEVPSLKKVRLDETECVHHPEVARLVVSLTRTPGRASRRRPVNLTGHVSTPKSRREEPIAEVRSPRGSTGSSPLSRASLLLAFASPSKSPASRSSAMEGLDETQAHSPQKATRARAEPPLYVALGLQNRERLALCEIVSPSASGLQMCARFATADGKPHSSLLEEDHSFTVASDAHEIEGPAGKIIRPWRLHIGGHLDEKLLWVISGDDSQVVAKVTPGQVYGEDSFYKLHVAPKTDSCLLALAVLAMERILDTQVSSNGPASLSTHPWAKNGLDLGHTLWRYQPFNGKAVDIRAEPAIDGERTEHEMKPGEYFGVCEEKVDGGAVFLKLTDGRGWLFDRVPGDTMCVRTDETSSGEGPGRGYLRQFSFGQAPRPKGRSWRYEPFNNAPCEFRAEAGNQARRRETVPPVEPGEELLVSQEVQGEAHVLHLKLADGRGWLFDRTPAKVMCTRAF